MQARLCGRPRARRTRSPDGMRNLIALDPFFADMLERARQTGWAGMAAVSPGEARAFLAAGRAALGNGPQMKDVSSVRVPTRAGSIPAKVYTPHDAWPGLTVYLHGGGWVVGELDDFAIVACAIAAESRRPVLMPAYRLAPEHPFPAALEDCEDTLRWASDAGRGLGAPPLAVAGDSAGANLATVAARRLRGRVGLALQVLLYPVTDHDFSRCSYLSEGDGRGLTRRDMQWFFSHYAPPGRHDDPSVSPLKADDLSGSPPTVVITAEHDVLRDEGEAYAKELASQGVPVELRRYSGAIHGFVRLLNHYEPAREAVGYVGARLAAAFDQAGRR